MGEREFKWTKSTTIIKYSHQQCGLQGQPWKKQPFELTADKYSSNTISESKKIHTHIAAFHPRSLDHYRGQSTSSFRCYQSKYINSFSKLNTQNQFLIGFQTRKISTLDFYKNCITNIRAKKERDSKHNDDSNKKSRDTMNLPNNKIHFKHFVTPVNYVIVNTIRFALTFKPKIDQKFNFVLLMTSQTLPINFNAFQVLAQVIVPSFVRSPTVHHQFGKRCPIDPFQNRNIALHSGFFAHLFVQNFVHKLLIWT